MLWSSPSCPSVCPSVRLIASAFHLPTLPTARIISTMTKTWHELIIVLTYLFSAWTCKYNFHTLPVFEHCWNRGPWRYSITIYELLLTTPPPPDPVPFISSDKFVCVSLLDAALSDASLSDVLLSDGSLSDASLSDAILSDASLSDAILSDASLSDASLSDA